MSVLGWNACRAGALVRAFHPERLMTRKLDLRTGRPVWFAYRAPRVEATPLTRDVRADVVVVGLGISGAMIAEVLTAQGLSVIGIDRRGPLRGSTPATTALVQFEIDQPLARLSHAIGKEKAVRAWRRSRLAVANLAGHILRCGIRCDLVRRPSLYLAGDMLNAGGLQREGLARRAAGIACDFLPRKALVDGYGIDRPAALRSEANLALDPRRLTAGLLNRAAATGARFHAPVEATGFDHDPRGVAIATRHGPVLRAGHVVIATGYELPSLEPPAPHRVLSTWAIATRPQRRTLWPEQAFVWEASDSYLYMRTLPDGRIVCGGEDEDFTDEAKREAHLPEKTRRIAARLKALMPAVDPEPDYAWAGSFGSTSTGLPFIGRLPRRPNIFAVMGYGGNGITYSRIAAELVATVLAGGKDDDADLYAFPS